MTKEVGVGERGLFQEKGRGHAESKDLAEDLSNSSNGMTSIEGEQMEVSTAKMDCLVDLTITNFFLMSDLLSLL